MQIFSPLFQFNAALGTTALGLFATVMGNATIFTYLFTGIAISRGIWLWKHYK